MSHHCRWPLAVLLLVATCAFVPSSFAQADDADTPSSSAVHFTTPASDAYLPQFLALCAVSCLKDFGDSSVTGQDWRIGYDASGAPLEQMSDFIPSSSEENSGDFVASDGVSTTTSWVIAVTYRAPYEDTTVSRAGYLKKRGPEYTLVNDIDDARRFTFPTANYELGQLQVTPPPVVPPVEIPMTKGRLLLGRAYVSSLGNTRRYGAYVSTNKAFTTAMIGTVRFYGCDGMLVLTRKFRDVTGRKRVYVHTKDNPDVGKQLLIKLRVTEKDRQPWSEKHTLYFDQGAGTC